MTHLAVPVAPWPTSCKRESIPPPGQQLLTLLSMLPHGLHTLGGNRSLHLVNYDSPCCPCCPMASILQEGIDPSTWSTYVSPCYPCCPWPPSCRRDSIPPPGQLMSHLVVHVAPGLHPAGGQRVPHHQTNGVARLVNSTSCTML